MRSSTLKTFAAGVLAGGTLFMSYGVISQEYGEQSQEEMLKMWEELAKPGPQHAELAKQAGQWKQVIKQWDQDPAKAPAVTEGVSEFKSIFGGRFVTQNLRAEMQWGDERRPFEGLGVSGYDNLKQKYFFVWFDSMSSTYMVGEGDADASGKVITYYSECASPMGTMKSKSVARTVSNDENYFEMYMQAPDGTWAKHMEIHQTRVKAPARAPAGGH